MGHDFTLVIIDFEVGLLTLEKYIIFTDEGLTYLECKLAIHIFQRCSHSIVIFQGIFMSLILDASYIVN